MVIEWHYRFVPQDSITALTLVGRLVNLTYTGVDLFFVMSGFLLGGILLAHRESEGYFKTFYIRRFCRTLPLYLVSLTLFLILSGQDASILPAAAQTWLFNPPISHLSYVTLTQNISMAQAGSFGSEWMSVTWSLAVEEQFYLILPLMIRYCPLRHLPKLLVVIIVLAPLLRLYFVLNNAPVASYVLMPCRADELMLGVLCAYGLGKPRIRAWIGTHRRWLYGLLAVFLVGDLVLAGSVWWRVGSIWIAGGYACFMILAVTSGRLIKRITTARALTSLGVIAYGVYMFHQAINGFLSGLLLGTIPPVSFSPAGLAVHGIALILSLGVATLSWRYFERWFVGIGHRFQYRARVVVS